MTDEEILKAKLQALVDEYMAVPPKERLGVTVVHLSYSDLLVIGPALGLNMDDPFAPEPPETLSGA